MAVALHSLKMKTRWGALTKAANFLEDLLPHNFRTSRLWETRKYEVGSWPAKV
jgi:hypothetical protein